MGAYTTPFENQNKAGEQYAAALPKMPGYCFDDKVPFAAMRTPQDQIHWLYKHLKGVESTIDYNEIMSLIADINKRIEEILKIIADLSSQVKKNSEMIIGLAEQSMEYDVTSGVYRPSISTERRIWQAEAPFGMTVEEMGQFKVGEMTNYTCIQIAKRGRKDILDIDTPRDIIAEQTGYSVARYNPADYIRRDELELIEVSNLQDGTIYGLPEGSKAVPTPKLAALMRRANVTDLNEAVVYWNQHLGTTNTEVI